MLPEKNQEDISKIDAITLALEDAGGGRGRVDTEDVAVAAYRLAPNYFSWRKHAEHIDLDLVRMTLRHATERGYGSRIGGSIKVGWHLTARGLEWLAREGKARRRSLGPPTVAINKDVDKPGKDGERRLDLNRLRRTEAFGAWKRGDGASPRAAAAAFRIDAYTPAKDRTFLVAQFVRAAEEAGDNEITRFVLAMEKLALAYQVPGAPEGKKEGPVE